MQHQDPAVALIGGSGLYDLDGLKDTRTHEIVTPFGDPSAPILEGRLGDTRLLFLVRHGDGHRFSPSDVPYRANIFALRSLGARWVVAASAVGSLREEIRPGDIAVPDQILDRTRGVRPASFFGEGCVAHVQFGDPYCGTLRNTLLDAARQNGSRVHESGTYVCMEGPQFSTRAESNMYRFLGAQIIGMTSLPEAKLAREAQMCYATLALITDYDCWRETEEEVSVDMVLAALAKSAATARSILAAAAPTIATRRTCACRHALDDAIMTAPDRISAEAKEWLKVLRGP